MLDHEADKGGGPSENLRILHLPSWDALITGQLWERQSQAADNASGSQNREHGNNVLPSEKAESVEQ